jgi:hypothetical protein
VSYTDKHTTGSLMCAVQGSITVGMIVAIFWDIVLCSLNVNSCLGRTFHLHLQGRKSAKQETSMQ